MCKTASPLLLSANPPGLTVPPITNPQSPIVNPPIRFFFRYAYRNLDQKSIQPLPNPNQQSKIKNQQLSPSYSFLLSFLKNECLFHPPDMLFACQNFPFSRQIWCKNDSFLFRFFLRNKSPQPIPAPLLFQSPITNPQSSIINHKSSPRSLIP